jgi:hypothetical protein
MPGYVLDASIWIRIGRHHPPDIFKRLWTALDGAIASGVVCSPEEVLHELARGTDGLDKLLSGKKGLFIPLDEPLQVAVAAVLAECRTLAEPEAERNRADPFVVALAQLHGHTVVTGERPRRDPSGRMKIPDACDRLGIPWMDWFAFLRATGWEL